MVAFYRSPPPSYYQFADNAAQHYTPREQPFHCDLVGRVQPGNSVLEVGCGTAHLCPHVEAQGGSYTGLDFSAELLAANRRKFPRARFFPIGTAMENTFDLVASLFTIEHIADPPAYLKLLWQYCRPGGLVAIICPEFVNCPGYAPSIFFGRTPRRLREKLKRFDLPDVIGHLLDLKRNAPRWKQRALAEPPGAFWINLRPRILQGIEFASDTDAVHMVRREDLVWYYEQLGAEIVQTSAAMADVPPAVSRFSCYVLARKPLSGSIG